MADVDLNSAQRVSPVALGSKVETSELKGLPKAGVDLAKWVLVIMAAAVLLLIVCVGASEFIHSQWLHAQALPLDQAEVIIKEQVAAREFWLKVFQVVLLNEQITEIRNPRQY
jgi:hypothetical protein